MAPKRFSEQRKRKVLQLTQQRIFILPGLEVSPMRCILHIWKSDSSEEKPIHLHILPLNAAATLQSTEGFDSEDHLCERLTGIGLSPVQVVLTLHNLRDERDAMWTNVEIAEPAAQAVEHPPSEHTTLAA